MKRRSDQNHCSKQEFLEIVKAGDLKEVCRLIESGMPVNYKFGESPLPIAARCGHLEIAEYLYSKEADIHSRGGDAIRYAAAAGQTEMISWLLERGAEINGHKGSTPLSSAALVRTSISTNMPFRACRL